MSQTNVAFGSSDAQAFGPGGAHAETVINQSNHGGFGEQSNLAFGTSHAVSHGFGPANAVTEINQSNEAGGWGYHGPQSNLAFGASNAEGGGFPWGGCFPHGGSADAHTSINQHNCDTGYTPSYPSCEPAPCGEYHGFGYAPAPQMNLAVGTANAFGFGPTSAETHIDQSNASHDLYTMF